MSTYANLRGRDGIVAAVPLDQSYRGALYQFERAYLNYHLGDRCGRYARLSCLGDISHFYRRCRQLGVSVNPR